MAEGQPNHIPEPQRAPHERGNDSLGLPPTLNERAKPPPESPKWGGRLVGERSTIWSNCAIPNTAIPPVHLRPMLRSGDVTEEQAQEFEREWREKIKTWDRQRLEEQIRSGEERRDRAARRNRQESVQDVEYQLEILQEEFRQRQ